MAVSTVNVAAAPQHAPEWDSAVYPVAMIATIILARRLFYLLLQAWNPAHNALKFHCCASGNVPLWGSKPFTPTKS